MLDVVITFVLGTVLFRLSVIDLKTMRISNHYTLPLIAAGLGVNAADLSAVPWSHVVASSGGYLVFALIGESYFRLRGIDGLGLGDAKLLAAAGAWVGLTALPVVILLAALGGLAFAVSGRLDKHARLAFGPWLSIAFFIVWIAGLG